MCLSNALHNFILRIPPSTWQLTEGCGGWEEVGQHRYQHSMILKKLRVRVLLLSHPYPHTPFSNIHVNTLYLFLHHLPFLASLLLFYNTLDVLSSLQALGPTSIIFLPRSQQTVLTGPSSPADRPHPRTSTVLSLDGPRNPLPTMFTLWSSLKDALKNGTGRSLGELLIPSPISQGGGPGPGEHTSKLLQPQKVQRLGKNLEPFP